MTAYERWALAHDEGWEKVLPTMLIAMWLPGGTLRRWLGRQCVRIGFWLVGPVETRIQR